MKFVSYLPSEQLLPYIRSYAIHEADEENTYKVLPDTGVVIGFQYKGGLSVIKDTEAVALAVSGVSGLADRFKVFKNSVNIGTLLVFFREAGAAMFFKQPIHELFRESVSLDYFMLRSELLLLEEQLYEAKTDSKKVQVIERFLLKQLSPSQPDQLVLGALALIHQAKGNIRIKELATQLNTSQSPLEKKFRAAVGTSPKKYASIVRFKNIIEQYNLAHSMTALGIDGGYYDQSHFIKQFKNFTGDTPEDFFANK